MTDLPDQRGLDPSVRRNFDAVEKRLTTVEASAVSLDGRLDTIDALSLGSWFAPAAMTLNTALTVTADRVYYQQIYIPLGADPLHGIAYNVGATSSGNARSALYNAAGTRVANRSSASASPGTFSFHQVPFDANYDPAPGVYFIALVFSSGTQTCSAGVVNAPASHVAGPGSGATATSITPPTAQAFANYPTMTTY